MDNTTIENLIKILLKKNKREWIFSCKKNKEKLQEYARK